MNGRKVKIVIGKKSQTLRVPSVEKWNLVVENLLPSLKPGMILALSGPLGAGKTTFVQALARALGVTKNPPSPTFALMRSYRLPQTYQGIQRLIHVDAYRLESEREMLSLDLDEELSDGASVLVLEWPEKVSRWIASRKLRVDLSIQ